MPAALLAGLLRVQHARFLLRAAAGIKCISSPALAVFLQKNDCSEKTLHVLMHNTTQSPRLPPVQIYGVKKEVWENPCVILPWHRC